MPSFLQTFGKAFDPDLLITNPFEIVAPPEVPTKDLSKLKAVLKSLIMDDGGTIGSFVAPVTFGQVFSRGNIWEVIASGTNVINGTVQNVIVTSCGVLAEIEWVYEGFDCPEGQCKCETDVYPGYCCISCPEIAGELRAITEQVKRV